MKLKFMALAVQPAWPCGAKQVIMVIYAPISGFFKAILYALTPFESIPKEAEDAFPEQTNDIPDAQLMLCQSILDECKERREFIEQKGRWLFTIVSFLMPGIIVIMAFLFQGSTLESGQYAITLSVLGISAFLLVLSFVSILRAMAIRPIEVLHLYSVINKEDGTFLPYNRPRHAQGLLHCATMNTASNDHIAQFVKGAHILMTVAVILATVGLISIGTGIGATTERSAKTDHQTDNIPGIADAPTAPSDEGGE